jgi:hypothetical protein
MFVLTTLTGFAAIAQMSKLAALSGKWEISGETNASLEIIDSSNILFTYMGENKKISNVRFDLSKSPHWFDFTAKDSVGEMHVKGLMEIVNENIIKWQLFIDEERPAHFTTAAGELLFLKRKISPGSTVVTSN